MKCAFDPCTFATCAAAPEALCIPNYCGGCTAIFYELEGGLVECGKGLLERVKFGTSRRSF